MFLDLSEDRREVELAGVDAANYRKVVEERARLAIVHVCSHSRQRQNVVRVMTFASVSMLLPLQKGQTVGRATTSSPRDSVILIIFLSRLSRAVSAGV
jgi:hypothetical protein